MAALSRARLTADVLFLGVTRPALAFGVPYAALLLNAMVTLELFLLTRNLLCIVLCVPLHGLTWIACLAEPRFFELVALWGRVRAPARRSVRAWGALGYAPLSGGRSDGPGSAITLVVESAGARHA